MTERDYHTKLTALLRRVIDRVSWTADDLARETGAPKWRVERWLDGRDRPNWGRLFAVDALRPFLVIEMAKLADMDVTETPDGGVTITAVHQRGE